ncbi:MAG: type II secretion system F family protein [Verrucomicrobia bacterium]|nr:type II secretion system F family protein [Verrucomicrobiota bacterium]MCH8511417.1 type II secretion system F family protein [Kiritimatiellia bacterium]
MAETFKIPGSKKIQNKDLPVFTRLLGAMLDAGMPLVQVLETLESETGNKNFLPVLMGIREYVEGGESLSEAMAHYPTVFDNLYLSMIRAGETSGMMSDIAMRLAGYLEEAVMLKRKVKSAMMYPVMVTLVAIALTTGMILFIVPAFAEMYADFDSALPAPTQALVNLSEFLNQYFLVTIGVLLAVGIGFSQYKKTPAGRYSVDKLKLHMPVFGELIKKVSLARFASTFAELTRAGVPIIKTLDIVAAAANNAVLTQAVLDASPKIEGGANISASIGENPEFPRLLIQMMSAGEKSGKMDDMLQRIADIYKGEVDATVDGLTSLIEPLLITFLGVTVGGIVIAMFMPIFRMTDIIM